jgi:hypothetical protein
MSARQSKAVHDALQAVKSGARPVDAARVHGCHVQSLYRALRALNAKGPAIIYLTGQTGSAVSCTKQSATL